jgi:hypothetical protein
MMDIDTIVALNKEAGNKAKRHGIKPTTFTESGISKIKDGQIECLRDIVNIGNYTPKGWRRFDVNKWVEEWDLPYSFKFLDKGGLFVDSSGFGSDNEPALTVDQLLDVMAQLLTQRSDLGFGIISEGQFQITIGVFENVRVN